jgi:hypothetical protein
MPETIENINRKFIFQIESILMILMMLMQLVPADSPLYADIKTRHTQCINLNNDYKINSVGLLVRYYENENITNDFTNMILVNQLISRISDLTNVTKMLYMKVALKTNIGPVTVKKIDNLLLNVKSIEINIDQSEDNFQECVCGNVMSIKDCAEMKCDDCGKIRILRGTVFEKYQLGLPDDDKPSNNSGYTSNKHYKYWAEKILAEEQIELSPENEALIESAIVQKKYKRDKLLYKHIRQILKEKKLTYLNQHIPFIMKKYGGPTPPMLSFNEKKKNSIIFDKIISIHDVLKDDDRNNRRYYPYFILKAIETQFRILPSDSNDEKIYKREKLRIALFIHLQNSNTVKKHDIKYKEICEYHRDHYPNEEPLFYQPTDRAYINEGILRYS